MEDMELDESIRVMCETILKNHNSMDELIRSSLEKANVVIDEINEKRVASKEDTRVIREMNRLIDSISMYEWLLVKKIEVIEELIRYV